MTLSLPVG